jgi:hypothetical protein
MLTNSHLVVAALLQVFLLGPASASDKRPDECGLASFYSSKNEATASGENTIADIAARSVKMNL